MEDGLLGVNRMTEPQAGSNLKLSLDYELQKKAQEYFLGLSGSVVVMDVNTWIYSRHGKFSKF